MDNFAEQLVKKQISGGERFRTVALMVGGGLLILFLVVTSFLSLGTGLFSFVGMVLAIAAAVMTYLTYRNTQVEYEYTYTNGELDVDKIIARSKRREMITVDVKKFTDFGKYDENTPEETADMTVVLATDNILSHEYYADFSSEDFGLTRLIFCPDERMLENIKRGLSGALKKKLNG